MIIEWPSFIDNAGIRFDHDAQANIHKMDVKAMNEVMEKNEFMNFEMYRK